MGIPPFKEIDKTLVSKNLTPVIDQALVRASQAIRAKAAQLTPTFTGASTSGIEPLTEGTSAGYQQMFANCTIFYSDATGAHEVHGDILRKYVILPLKRMYLGFPTTDESPASNGGRFNHFSNDASIYWHPTTGPMVVQGAVRDRWAAQGWEQGPLGYPVRDVFVPETGELSGDFQNGVVWIGPNGYVDAKTASMTSDQFLTMVWQQFNAIAQQSPDNIGLQPNKSFDGVTDTGYGFAQSTNRGFKCTINGFHDQGLLLPDINWAASMGVVVTLGTGLSTNAQNQTVEVYNVGAQLQDIHVTNSGLLTDFTDKVATTIQSKLQGASDAGIGFGQSISMDAPLLSLKMMLDGTLTFFLSPTPAGGLAQFEIQRAIDAM